VVELESRIPAPGSRLYALGALGFRPGRAFWVRRFKYGWRIENRRHYAGIFSFQTR
jgi:hypothetical protein